MRIGFVIQRYGAEFVGGAEKYTRSLASGLAAMGHEITVVTSCATSYADWADVYPPGTAVDEGVTVHRLPVRAPRDNDRFLPLHLRAVRTDELPLWPWAQERWAQTMGPELLDGPNVVRDLASSVDVTVLVGYHYAQTLVLTRAAAVGGPTIVVPTAHPEGAFHVGRVGEVFQHADHVVCLADEEADLVAATYGVGDRIDVVPCPVEPVVAPGSGEIRRVRDRFGLDDPYAIVVGRIDPAKGSDDAIRYTSAHRRNVDAGFQLVVVGPGAEDRVLPDGIVGTGFVDDATKDALVAGASVLVQPSYMESFSLSLMEGWLFERPALIQRRSRVLAGHAARSGGGLTYDDYLDWEAALVLLDRDPELAARLGAAGRRYVLETFAWDRVATRFLEVAAIAADTGKDRIRHQRRSRTA